LENFNFCFFYFLIHDATEVCTPYCTAVCYVFLPKLQMTEEIAADCVTVSFRHHTASSAPVDDLYRPTWRGSG